jgi:hypothetical protein
VRKKRNLSRERYDVYKVKTTITRLEALRGVNCPGTTRPVYSGGTMVLNGDFAHGVAHDFFTFAEAAVSPTAAVSVPAMRAASVTCVASPRTFGV